MSIQYGTDDPFYNVIFKKKESVKTTQETTQKTTTISKSTVQNIFGVNNREFRSIFGVNILNTIWLIHKNPSINAQEIAEKLSVTKRTAENYLSKLKEAKYIERIGSDKTGHWKVIKK